MATAQQTQMKRHPIRGAIYGILAGIGAAVYLMIFSVTPYSVTTVLIVTAIGLVVGALWGAFAPAKQSKDMPPQRSGASFSMSHDTNNDPPPTYETTFSDGTDAPSATPRPTVDDGAFGAETESDADTEDETDPSGEAPPPV
jgi:hypothetical protein